MQRSFEGCVPVATRLVRALEWAPRELLPRVRVDLRLFELARAHALDRDIWRFFRTVALFRPPTRERDQRRRRLVRVTHEPMEREYFFSVKKGIQSLR